jgi:uncharacterized protein DUF5597/glycosyl hydrolase family 42 (putative beta-galactosidase)
MSLASRLVAGGVVICAFAPGACAQRNISHLEKHGNAARLIVDGKPFLILGGELLNSSSSSLSYMQPIWQKLAAMHLNTVVAPVAWETIEPQEGKFDFTVVDGLIAGAREHELRLVFLWFGSWKNTYSSYVPEWVKRDTKRFPRVLLRDGRPTERLSPLNESNRNADATAFAALMKHVREVDAAHTVIMVQVENEVGVIPESRDHSAVANAAFAAAVPKELMDYIGKHNDELAPELHAAWVAAGKKTKGSWEDIFGQAPITDDFFMAWQYATYIDAVTAAGKAEYPLPMYTNAALIRPNYQPGQYNSGGPLPHSMDIYRAGAPHLDFLSPDVYFDNYAFWVGKYKREGNPVFVPEARGGLEGAANALYTFGELDGLGFSPFAIDGHMSQPETEKLETIQQPITALYSEMSHLAPLILEKQGTGQMTAMVLEGEAQRNGRLYLGGYSMTLTRSRPAAPDRPTEQQVAVLFLQTGTNEFIAVGAGDCQVTFAPDSEGPSQVGIVSIDEEVLVNGEWVRQRRLNGDENGQGQVLRMNADGTGKASVYRVRLYRY